MNCPRILVDARRGGTTPGVYAVPGDAELRAIELAVSSLVRADEANAKTHAAQAGFEVVAVDEWPGTVALVQPQNRGGGAYVVRLGGSSRLAVQTPHTFFDEGTFPLGCAFFDHASVAWK